MRISDGNARFLADRRMRDCTAPTLRFYEQQVRYLCVFLAGRGVEDTDSITAEDAVSYVESLKARRPPLSPVTVRKWATATRTYYHWLYRSGLTKTDIARHVPVPRARQRLPKALSEDQARRLLAGACGERDQAIVSLLLDTGLRLAEICALDVGDIDMQSCTVHVRRGKGGKERFTVFADDCQAALERWLVARGRLSLQGIDAVFISRTNERLTGSGLYKTIARIGRSAGLDVSPHMLRHTFATLYLDGGGAIQDAADLLGHEQITTTMLYTHTTTATLRRKHGAASPLSRISRTVL